MEVIVGSKYLTSDISVSVDAQGREHLIVVAKSSWLIPEAGQRPRPISPVPIEKDDVFIGVPGESAMVYGSDIVRFKPRCDVLFNANVHSPDGQPLTEINAVWQVGPLRKGLKVYGPRKWRKRLGLLSLTSAEPFIKAPLHFGMAFGGTRTYTKGWNKDSPIMTEAHPTNPAGLGWFGARSDDSIDGQAAPQLEALNDPITKPSGKQKPIAFSAIARHWKPRPTFAGTYDAIWLQNVFPFLPEDFDEQFHQCAPEDQQMPYPSGGESVILRNMMEGRPDVRFTLPRLTHVKVRILRKDYSVEEPPVVVDTLYFEPDQARFTAVWRASIPIRRRIQEIATIAVGSVNTEWWHRKISGADGCVNCGATAADADGTSEKKPSAQDLFALVETKHA